MATKKAVRMNLTRMSVDPQTSRIYNTWKKDSRRGHSALFEQLVIHAVESGFDPLKAKIRWG